jgi:ketosteroid isomerase-like protein
MTSRSSATTVAASKEEQMAEALIRRRIEDGVKAIRAKDIDGVMRLYARDLV